MGAVPADIALDGGALMLGGARYDALIAAAGRTPLFVYDLSIVARRVARLRAAMPAELGIHYAVKANPCPPFVVGVAALVDGLDIASAGELDLVRGAAPDVPVSFAGPGKTDAELAAAIAAGVTINLESEGEADRALAIADTAGAVPRLAVRVNPDFELRGSGMRMGGRASPFGIDAERVPALVRRLIAAGVDWRGFYIFAGSQALDAAAIAETQRQTLALAARMAGEVGMAPPLVNLGGGFGIPYFPGDVPLDIEAIGAALGEQLARDPLPGPRFAIELGRWLVGEAGVYLTRIVDRKVSRGETFLIVDGGLHHQLAASGNFGTVVRRNYPLALAGQVGAAGEEVVHVVGCLCTPLDRLGDAVSLPRAKVGDVIAVFMAGAYGLSASPKSFLGHDFPPEIVVGGANTPNAIFTC